MKKINASVLNVGDIILTTTNTLISRSIRSITRSDISHAMLYVDSYSVIDSTGDGVHGSNTQRLFYDDNCEIYALRLERKITKEELKKVISYARSCIGTEYTKTEAAKTIIGGKTKASKKQFCSRFVARAFAYADIFLVDDPDFCTPDELLNSKLLKRIENSKKVVTSNDLAVNEIFNIPQLMREIENFILKGARKSDSSIQSFSDMDSFLIKNPRHDSYFSTLYLKSGYLDVWKVEKNKNEWHYDINKMIDVAGQGADVRKLCEALTANCDLSLSRYKENFTFYLYYHGNTKLKTFKILLDLYLRLIELHITRTEVAKAWLANDK